MKITGKAIEIVSTFNKRDKREFRNFLLSPFLNRNTHLLPAFEMICKLKEVESPEPEQRTLYSAVYPGEKFNGVKFRKLMSDLLKCLKKFLFLSAVINEKHIENRYLLTEYWNRSLDNLFDLTIDKAIDYAKDKTPEDNRMLLEEYLLEELNIGYNIERNRQSAITANVIKRGDALSLFFLGIMFKSVRDVEANRSSFNAAFERSLAEEIDRNLDIRPVMDIIIKKGYRNSAFIEVNYGLHAAWRDFENEELYFEAKALFQKKLNRLSPAQIDNIITTMMNYCMKKNQSMTKHDFNSEKLWIYNIYLEKKIYKLSKHLTITMYMNILKLMLMKGELQKAEEFVKSYSAELAPEETENMINFSMALLLFQKGDHERTLHYAARVKQLQPSDKIGLNLIISCSHYELGNFTQCMDEIRNFRIFLKSNKKLAAYFTVPAQGFCRLITLLLNFTLKQGKGKNLKKDELVNFISMEKHTAMKSWLIQKAREA